VLDRRGGAISLVRHEACLIDCTDHTTMFKRPTYWPAHRRLFRDKPSRSVITTWIVWILSIAAAVLLAGFLRSPTD
jgi:hypothetical protein